MGLLIKNRSLRTKIYRDHRIIFDGSSPKHGGAKTRTLLTALGITEVEETFNALVRAVNEDEWQHCVAQLQHLDARKEQERTSIDTICGTLSGLATSVEIIERTEESA